MISRQSTANLLAVLVSPALSYSICDLTAIKEEVASLRSLVLELTSVVSSLRIDVDINIKMFLNRV